MGEVFTFKYKDVVYYMSDIHVDTVHNLAKAFDRKTGSSIRMFEKRLKSNLELSGYFYLGSNPVEPEQCGLRLSGYNKRAGIRVKQIEGASRLTLEIGDVSWHICYLSEKDKNKKVKDLPEVYSNDD